MNNHQAITIADELSDIAGALALCRTREQMLYDRRLSLWRQGKALGMPTAELAASSELAPVTVRQMMNRSPL